jgi:hypothetical protein
VLLGLVVIVDFHYQVLAIKQSLQRLSSKLEPLLMSPSKSLDFEHSLGIACDFLLKVVEVCGVAEEGVKF